ncbi:MAG: hypothetical protein ACRDLF_16430 [Solirubrobacteraceae bacterium]
MTPGIDLNHGDDIIRELLAPFARVQPVKLQRHPAGQRRLHGLARMRSWRSRMAIVVSVTVLAVLGAGSALAYHYLGPSPGFTAGLSALNKLPPVAWPSSLPKGGLADEAAATGLTASQAEQRLRLLQSGLSLGNTNGIGLYAFQGNSGSACIFLTGSGGICLPTWMTSNPALDSVAWAAWGGDSPQTPGPLAVFGLVADNVKQVEADISGVTRNIPIVNNSFYTDYDSITGTDTIKLIVNFDDGTSRTYTAPNPYPQNGPTQLSPNSQLPATITTTTTTGPS